LTEPAASPRRLAFRLSGDVPAVMQQVEAIETFVLDAGGDPASAQQVAIVAEEILTNILRNAWGDGPQGVCEVELSAEPAPTGLRLTLRAEDDGRAFDPLAADAPDLDAPLEEREIGGLGIHLIRMMTDQQSYCRSAGRNVLVVEKMVVRPADG
jgi:anti-sigma regulatory factor (Ser/Thr protein kinase)